MIKQVLGVEINISGINVALINIDTKLAVPQTAVRIDIDTNETAENLIMTWAEAIKQAHILNSSEISLIGVAIPGPFDYRNGICLMKNQEKFDSLYKLNIKELLAEKLDISPLNIRMENNAACLLQGEVFKGSAQGYKNVLGFALNTGLGTTRYHNGAAEDANLWRTPFKDGIAEDYLSTKWLTNRYKEFTGENIPVKKLAEMGGNEDGLAQLVFNEYGENFGIFLSQCIHSYDPDLVLIGGNNSAWDLFIPHVMDRLSDRGINIPVKKAILGEEATLIGAASLWN